MKKIYFSLLLLFAGFNVSAALYTSPGTGVNWTLDDLVVHSGGIVLFNGTEYIFKDSITIRTNDVIRIEENVIVKFDSLSIFKINGSIIINPTTGVLFTASDPARGYLGLRIDLSASSSINKLTLEYANTLAILDCSPGITNSIFRYNGISRIGNETEGAINLFRTGKILISNCTFLQNRRAAIQGGATVANAPQISNCIFLQNNTSNSNRPQINLGTSGTDTTRIIGCQLIGGNTNSGAIGFLPAGLPVYAFINRNYIKGNRYGIVFNGGSSINSLISYNQIEDNNIENNPNLGGSGINFTGSASQGAQNSVVTGNIIAGNLWGITIQGRTRPNIGNLNNADTSDDGKNRFINNTNASTPGIDLYNNTVDPIFAMGNYWNTNIESEVEGKIFHQFDNPALGLVTYSSFLLPVELISFTATKQNNDVALQWKTAQETNSRHFDIERSFDGTNFSAIATKAAAGNSNTVLVYNYTDADAAAFGGTVYYRLKLVDIDGSYKYSPIAAVNFPSVATRLVRYYPTTVAAGTPLATELISDKNQKMNVQYFDANGKLLATGSKNLVQGFNKVDLAIPATAKGAVMIKMNAEGFNKTIPVIAQ